MTRPQRLVLLVAAVIATCGIGVGLWPATAETATDASYDCGSAFGEMFGSSEDDWLTDSFGAAIEADRVGGSIDVTALPDEVCPSKVAGRRTLALVLLAVAAVVTVGGAAAFRSAR